MDSKFARRALAAVALPGALLAVGAPAASAVEVTGPVNEAAQQVDGDEALQSTPELPASDALTSGHDLAL